MHLGATIATHNRCRLFGVLGLTMSVLAAPLVASAQSRGGGWAHQDEGLGWLRLSRNGYDVGEDADDGIILRPDATEGIRLSKISLHPGGSLELGYDSNLFREASGIESSLIARLGASLDLHTLVSVRYNEEGEEEYYHHRRYDLQASIGAAFYAFLTDSDPINNASISANLALTINPDGNYMLRIQNRFQRGIRPFTDKFIERIRYGRDTNIASIDLLARSDREVLQGRLSYSFQIDHFEDDNFDYGNSYTHEFTLAGYWRFFPFTAFLYRTKLSLQRYRQLDDGPITVLASNKRVHTQVGLNGAFTHNLHGSIIFGYAAGFYDEGDNYDSWTASLEARWSPNVHREIAAGYLRGFNNGFIGNYHRTNQIYLRGREQWNRLVVAGEASVAFAETGRAFAYTGSAAGGFMLLGTSPQRNDIRVSAQVNVAYRLLQWLSLVAHVGVTLDFTDYDVLFADVADPESSYRQFEIWLGARFRY